MNNEKRTLKTATLDLFIDQINFLDRKANKTGTKKAALVRQAIDEKYGAEIEAEKK